MIWMHVRVSIRPRAVHNDPDLAIAHPSDPNIPKAAMIHLATIALKNF